MDYPTTPHPVLEDLVRHWRPRVTRSQCFGVPLEEMTRDELLAVAAWAGDCYTQRLTHAEMDKLYRPQGSWRWV